MKASSRGLALGVSAGVLLFVALLITLASIRVIAPTQVNLITKRFSPREPSEGNPIALAGEPDYQADLLMPGLQWNLRFLYRVETFPWMQVPDGEIGVVIAQVGRAFQIGAKSAAYKRELGIFTDLRGLIADGVRLGSRAARPGAHRAAAAHPGT